MTQEVKKPKITTVEVGPFRLPGLSIDIEQYTPEQLEEIRAWGLENGGKPMTETLWSFRDPGKRDWFILRWT